MILVSGVCVELVKVRVAMCISLIIRRLPFQGWTSDWGFPVNLIQFESRTVKVELWLNL